MKIAEKRKLTFFSIFFTFILDNLGWSLVIPIFAPLFLGTDSTIFGSEVSIGTRTVLLGLFLGAFPLAQFFGAPILGEYGDKAGRKKAFILSIALTFVGYVLSAWSIGSKNLILLFIGRLISGLFAGNLSICLASIADLSACVKAKTKNFGYLSIFAGISLILGAFLGGKLADSKLSSLFNPAFPLWIASALALLNLIFIIFAFYETTKPKNVVKFHLLGSFSHIKKGLLNKRVNRIYLIYFLFILSWSLLFQFSPVLVINRFNYSYSEIGNLAALMGVCWAIGSGMISKVLSSRFSNITILEFTLLAFILPYTLIGFFHHAWIVILLIAICALFGGISWPVCNAVISERAPQNMQGKILGITQSMQSLAIALAPIIGGYFANLNIIFPFILAALTSIVGVGIYIQEKV